MARPEISYRLPDDFDPAGRVVFLGSSLGSAGLMWARARNYLSGQMQLVTWDLPGHGDSDAAREAFSLRDIADELVAIADRLGVAKFDYAGVSISGAIGLELSIHHGDRLRSCAIMFSAAKLGTAEAWADRCATVRSLGTQAMIDGLPERWFSPSFIAEDALWVDTMMDILADVDDESYAKCCEALSAYDVRDSLSLVEVPTLVIAGDHDPSVSADMVRELMTGLPNAKLFVVEGGRHLAVVDFPHEVGAALNTFWSSIH